MNAAGLQRKQRGPRHLQAVLERGSSCRVVCQVSGLQLGRHRRITLSWHCELHHESAEPVTVYEGQVLALGSWTAS